MRYDKLLFLFIAISLLYANCRKMDPSWNADLLSPLLRSSLGLKQLIPDSIRSTKADGTVNLVYQKKLYDINVDSFFTFYDTGVTKSYNIDSLSLFSANINYPITLGQICRNSGLAGLIIASQHGNSIPIPGIPPISSPPLDINADTLFTDMTLRTGNIDISLKNGLPIDVTNVIFELKNSVGKEIIVTGNFPIIKAGTTETQTFSLAGKRLEGKLLGQLISLSSPGSNGTATKIDTSDAVVASFRVYDLHPYSATAVFPSQNLINKSQPFILKNLPVQLKNSTIKSGQIVLKLYSTLQDSIFFTYRLPSATLNGKSFEVKKTLNPAPPGGLSVFERIFDFSGYNLNLSGPNNDTFNTAYNEFIARVEYTGVLKTISLQDSFSAQIGFINLHPEHAVGYLGQQNYHVGPAITTIDVFKNINGNLNLKNAKVNIEAENYIGTDAQVAVQSLQSVNTRQNKLVPLTGTALQSPLKIARATDNNGNLPVNPSYAMTVIDNNNSNINAFLSNLPNQIIYEFDLGTNPNGNTNFYRDFIYDDKYLNLNLNIEIPLDLAASGIMLSDTVTLDLNNQQLDNIESAILYLISDNGFPLECSITMVGLNDALQEQKILLDGSQKILAADIDASGKVTTPKRSKLAIPLNKSEIDQLLKTKKIAITAKLDTKPDNVNVKLYDTYRIDLYLTGEFNYLVK